MPDTLSRLIRRYEVAASKHGRATLESRSTREVNRQHDVVARVYRELRSRGQESQMALLDLLDSPDRGVQTWVAAHALEFAPERGEPILTQLAKRNDILGFDAEMTLKEWRAGRLRFP